MSLSSKNALVKLFGVIYFQGRLIYPLTGLLKGYEENVRTAAPELKIKSPPLKGEKISV